MGLIRLHHGSWENHRVSRCTQAHTHMLNRISWMETITFTYTVCTRINQQTPLGCRSQECFSLSKRKKKDDSGGVETAWTSAGLDPCWSPWQPQKIPDPSLRLWRLDVGQRPALTQVCLQGAMLPEERRNRLFSAIKGKTNAPLEGGITPCLLII